VDSNTAVIIGGVGGAIIGAPVGYFVQRFFNRPRIHIGYAETNYEDIVSLPADLQQRLMRYKGFIDYVENQVRWHFLQRVAGNMFTTDELRVVHELAVHFSDLEGQKLRLIEADIADVKRTNTIDPRLVAELDTDYRKAYESTLAHDVNQDAQGTIQKVLSLLVMGVQMISIGLSWLGEFIDKAGNHLANPKPSTDKIVVRVGLGNQGFQDGVISTEARLKVRGKSYRLPMRLATRPWENESGKGPTNYSIIKSKSFQVIEFGVDQTVNAASDIQELRQWLKRGERVEFQVTGIGSKCAARHSFVASLPE